MKFALILSRSDFLVSKQIENIAYIRCAFLIEGDKRLKNVQSKETFVQQVKNIAYTRSICLLHLKVKLFHIIFVKKTT